ncbi:EcoAI/FtnUII family type I restriction enzme subunit R [Gandjariella thermophila]|uniref:DEAD/DEAH box helicase n=1 Tax=Gandjariella thermophila TaxID=1931992 RepID=A0A4D4J6S8_9PSEU|nr:DEAD/DEAH box helicase family protein [Gandjariella thermophila]GDY30216.1 DEAD/DEAH box helicase [Gandjariella thermophila]
MPELPRPEAMTIRNHVVPRLRDAGWSEHTWRQEYPITGEPRTVVQGRVRRDRPMRADFALLHAGHPICVVECKSSIKDVRDGVQQARRYAQKLDVPLAYATNGDEIIEIDMRRQTERHVARFRSPDEVWDYYREASELASDLAIRFFTTPYSRDAQDMRGNPKLPRYYQHVALQRTLRRIAAGDRKLLLVMATGTGKTALAAQLVYVLWKNHWPRGARHQEPRPRVLYLTDRDVLVTQPLRDYFRPMFGDGEDGPVTRIRGNVSKAKNLYFALYQALDAGGEERSALFEEFERDFFDLVIVDECHRGSASASSSWREVLDHFKTAVKLGMTATPVQEGDRDTIGYFGAPIYTYSLRDGIADGFLAPFEVIRARLDRDIDGVDIPEGTVDRAGQLVPAGTYGLAQFERTLVLPERTREVARYLTEYLRRTGEAQKMIIFCVDQEHAARMREELVNLNSDLMRRYNGRWVVRITSNERDRVELLDDFQREDSPTPVVAVTSQLLSTGVDVPTVRTIVLFRRIESMVEFKQIIGRGTRLAPDSGKEYFTIIDFTGATRKFEDPNFDGPPVRVRDVDGTEPQENVPEPLEVDDEPELAEPEPEYEQQDAGELPPDGGEPGHDEVVRDPDAIDDITRRSRKHVVDGYDVHLVGEQLYIMDAVDGGLRPVRLERWVRQRAQALGQGPAELLEQWATVRGRRELRELLGDALLFDVDELSVRLHQPDCDPIDLLLYLAWDWPLMSRRERVARFTAREREYLDGLSPEARQVLTTILDKYAAHGIDDLSTSALRTAPLSERGSVLEIARVFGGAEQLHEAIDDLGRRLFRAG